MNEEKQLWPETLREKLKELVFMIQIIEEGKSRTKN